MAREPPMTEWTAPRIRIEDFIKRPEWRALPLAIQVSVIQLRRGEQELAAAAELARRAGGGHPDGASRAQA
jgi:hypothetical protein